MRKIEQQMLNAIHTRKGWALDNTAVTIRNESSMSVFLHGNHIADIDCPTGFVLVNTDTLRRYPTNTTKSRLRALGAGVSTRKGITYLNNVAI